MHSWSPQQFIDAADEWNSNPEPASSQVSLDKTVRARTRDAIDRLAPNAEPLHAQFLAAAEPALLQVTIEHTGGNRANAAELLGIHRGTPRDRLRAYGIDDSST